MADGHIDKTIVGLAGAPGVLHDIVGSTLFVTSQTNDTHGVGRTLVADGMAMVQGTVDMAAQRVEGDIQEAVVLPVVGNGHDNLLVIRGIGNAGKTDILVGGTDAVD